MAESTFGRRAINDGKLVNRLREGKRITIDTLERIPGFHRPVDARWGDAAEPAAAAAGTPRSAQ